jgi:hypothetical protein
MTTHAPKLVIDVTDSITDTGARADIVLCPFCPTYMMVGRTIKNNVFQCVYCSSTCIISLQSRIIMTHDELKSMKLRKPDIIDGIKTAQSEAPDLVMVYDLKKIYKCTTSILQHYTVTAPVSYDILVSHIPVKGIVDIISDYCQFSDAETRQLIILHNKMRDNFLRTNAEYNTFLADHNIQINENKLPTWDIAINVNSYNLRNPNIPYPFRYNDITHIWDADCMYSTWYF